MDIIMEMPLYQQVKDNIRENSDKENNMVMDNLDGKMDQFIEDIIVWESDKDKENIFLENLRVFREEYGKVES